LPFFAFSFGSYKTNPNTHTGGTNAIFYAILTLAEAGDNIVSSRQLYGGTYTYVYTNYKKQEEEEVCLSFLVRVMVVVLELTLILVVPQKKSFFLMYFFFFWFHLITHTQHV
jgi:hypothetical protein